MGANKKLLANMRSYEISQETLTDKYAREMYELAGDYKQKQNLKTIIKTLKPKQNGKRN